jgi:Lrp/AsnC family transcriptional regulator
LARNAQEAFSVFGPRGRNFHGSAGHQDLDQLQRDASLALGDIAKRVGLSPSPCWWRIKVLEESGVIRRRVALLDAAALNVGVTVFVALRTSEHNETWLKAFARHVETIPEIQEVHRMSGETDYMLRIVVSDVAGYDAVYKRLIRIGGLTDVSSSFAMECIKSETALPLVHAKVD